jgi:5-methylcytosine-specific restriction endonuclease McrA
MGMTIKKAERLTGYEIRPLASTNSEIRFGAFSGGEVVLTGAAKVEWQALESLVRQAYRLHSQVVLHRSQWRCSRCNASRHLQIHHRRYRSHGGSHEINNLEPVCWDCHRLIHAREQSK